MQDSYHCGGWVSLIIYKIVLWGKLHSLLEEIDKPWMVLGDFNTTINKANKFGVTSLTGCKAFWKWIEKMNIIDIGY